MRLKERINDDMKNYMRAKDTYALEAVRMLKADIKNAEIDAKREMDDEEVIKFARSFIKKHTEAAEICEKAGRQDLFEKEQKYLAVIEAYLPKQLSKEELTAVVKQVLASLGEIDTKTGFGAVMKAVMSKVGSAADGKLVGQVVKEVLG